MHAYKCFNHSIFSESEITYSHLTVTSTAKAIQICENQNPPNRKNNQDTYGLYNSLILRHRQLMDIIIFFNGK